MLPQSCPCGSDQTFATCCQPRFAGTPAATAADLMRSRYSAYSLGNTDYLLATWHPDTRPASLTLDPDQIWTRLRILATQDGQPHHSTGTVHFRAHYRYGTEREVLDEVSRFVRRHGQWQYVAGTIY